MQPQSGQAVKLVSFGGKYFATFERDGCFIVLMKTSIQSIAIAATALLFTAQFTNAEDKPEGGRPPGGPGGPGGGRSFGTPEERLKRMTETLGLTQDQQDKIKAIYAKDADAMKALREKGRENLTEEERTKMRDAFKTQMEAVQAVLTEEQKTKMKDAFQRRGGPGGDRKPEGDKKPDAPKPEEKK